MRGGEGGAEEAGGGLGQEGVRVTGERHKAEGWTQGERRQDEGGRRKGQRGWRSRFRRECPDVSLHASELRAYGPDSVSQFTVYR